MWKWKSILLLHMALLTFVMPSTSTQSSTPPDKITAGLKKTFLTKSNANIIVSMGGGTQAVYDEISMSSYSTRQERASAAYMALNAHAAKSQSDILELLKSLPKYSTTTIKVHSFWISNQISIKGADKELIELLAGFESVAKIEEEQIIWLDEPRRFEPLPLQLQSRPKANSWGVEKIQAEEAWAYLDGNNGSGVVIGIIDTGARVSHEALRDSYKGGSHAWFDTFSTSGPAPIDDQGHGTHVTGTIAGSYGIGVCPGAKWIACKGFDANGSTTVSDLLKCGQFMACPTDYEGNNPDCNEIPDIVSNSWGSEGGNNFFNDVITAWRNVDIIPIFANGNSGYDCRTTQYPADNGRVIGVGATNQSDSITPFSSRGPSNTGGQKPDLSAPGFQITSADYTSDTSYVVGSGTSMACPHAAGVAGLLRAQNSSASYETVRSAMLQSGDRNLEFEGQVCNFVNDFQFSFPNFQFGYGRLNALAAVQLMEKFTDTK